MFSYRYLVIVVVLSGLYNCLLYFYIYVKTLLIARSLNFIKAGRRLCLANQLKPTTFVKSKIP